METLTLNDQKKNEFVDCLDESKIADDLMVTNTNPLVEFERRGESMKNKFKANILRKKIKPPKNQAFVLVNIGHNAQDPVCHEGCFRFLGAFPTTDSCLRFIKDHGTLAINTLKVLCCEPFPICQDIKDQLDPEYTANKIKHVMSKDRTLREIQNKKFDTMVEKRLAAELDEKGASENKASINEDNVRTKSTRDDNRIDILHTQVPRANEIRDQNFIVINILPDRGEAKSEMEPVITIFGAFSDLGEAQKFIQDTVQINNQYDLFIVDAYQWIFPSQILSSNIDITTEEWEHPECNKILQYQKIQTKMIDIYKEVCQPTHSESDEESDNSSFSDA